MVGGLSLGSSQNSYKQRFWEPFPGNSSEGAGRDRKNGKTNNGCVIELIATVGNGNSMLLGTPEDPCGMFIKIVPQGGYTHQLLSPTGRELPSGTLILSLLASTASGKVLRWKSSQSGLSGTATTGS